MCALICFTFPFELLPIKATGGTWILSDLVGARAARARCLKKKNIEAVDLVNHAFPPQMFRKKPEENGKRIRDNFQTFNWWQKSASIQPRTSQLQSDCATIEVLVSHVSLISEPCPTFWSETGEVSGKSKPRALSASLRSVSSG